MRKLLGRAALSAALLGGNPAGSATAANAGASRVLVVTAYEYTFQAPDSIASGAVTVRLVNRGKIGHQVALARLDDSSSLTRVMQSLVADKDRTGGIHWSGGVEGVVPAHSAETTIPLSPGRYVIVCEFDGDSGHAHVSMGMIRPLLVTRAATADDAALPPTSATIRLTDYRIAFSGKLHRGRQLVRVENDGTHLHHLNITRIVGKATLVEIDKWDGKSKPSPLEEVSGGAAILDLRSVSVIDLSLAPGRYLFACVLSDDKDSKPHFMLGMEQEVTIE